MLEYLNNLQRMPGLSQSSRVGTSSCPVCVMVLITEAGTVPASKAQCCGAHLAHSPHHFGPAGEAGSQTMQDRDVFQKLLIGLSVLTVVPDG